MSLQDKTTAELLEIGAVALTQLRQASDAVESIGLEMAARLALVSQWVDDAAEDMADDPDPPKVTVPAVAVDPIAFDASINITLSPLLSEYEQAQQIKKVWKRGARLIVPDGVTVAPIRLGAGWLKEFPDGSPVGDIQIAGQNEEDFSLVGGIEVHPTVSGRVSLLNLAVHPSSGVDKAAIKCVGECREVSFDMIDVHALGYPGSAHFGGFGAMWGIVLHGAKLYARMLTFEAFKEHGVYGMNCSGMDIAYCSNDTITIDGHEVGMGRTLITHQNRIPSPAQNGALGGAPSTGEIRLYSCNAYRCGHEGLLRGDKPSGGSDLTIGGHTGSRVIIDECTSHDPYSGGVAIWQERHVTEVSAANPAGVRVWQVKPGSVPDYPEFGLTHAVDDVLVRDNKQVRTDVEEGRTPILVSGARKAQIIGRGSLGLEFDHQLELPGQDAVPPCGEWEDKP